ncbi:MAG: TlpA family protein disulfide reductase [Dehalococcoidia bacterium]|nr:TlpA family protein disulfide reductase [Dehalococcoidia bacterium]
MFRNIVMGVVSLAVVGLLVLLGYGITKQGGSARAAGVAVNSVGQAMVVDPRPIADASLPLMDGSTLSISQLKGKVVVVNFWASWCPPCRTEAPDLEAVHKKYQDKGVVFLGINVWENQKEAQAFINEFGITYRNAVDKPGRVTVDFGVSGIPETYIINRDNYIVRRWIGPVTKDGLSALIDEVLAQPARSSGS